MRILIELQSLNNHIIDYQNYHKLQGFIYNQLISQTSFKDIHNTKIYKYFTFSNIFPSSVVKSGEVRYFIFSSPNYQLIQSVFKILETIILDQTIISIGEQLYIINSAALIKFLITDNRCLISNSTPITVRISERSYSKLFIPKQLRKKNFLYWRSNISSSVFIRLIEENIKRKFETFYKTRLKEQISLIEEFELVKEIIVHLPIGESTIKIPASFWNLYVTCSSESNIKLLNFILDSGLGERNSFGLGFINIKRGGKILELKRINKKK